MTFDPLMTLTVAKSLPRLPKNPTVVELGNQRFTADNLTLEKVTDALKGLNRNIDFAFLNKLKTLTAEEKKPHTENFYKALGFSSYASIDLNQNFGSMVMDLNKSLRKDYGFTRQYDLVTNNGTGEHIFNQYSVFQNMHDLTAPGGFMLFVLPFLNWVNHGFFNFNPLLFFDLAESNNYTVAFMSLSDSQAKKEIPVNLQQRSYNPDDNVSRSKAKTKAAQPGPFLTLKKKIYPLYSDLYKMMKKSTAKEIPVEWAVKHLKTLRSRDPLNLALSSILTETDNISVVCLLQKKEEKEFAVPIQGKYFHRIDLVEGVSL